MREGRHVGQPQVGADPDPAVEASVHGADPLPSEFVEQGKIHQDHIILLSPLFC